jgi:hypothetical protein
MGIYKSTMGRVKLSGCQVRRETGDTFGGTTIEQNAKVAAKHGVVVEVHTGSNVCTPAYLATKVQSGRGATVSGNCSALIGTPFRSNGSAVNHTVWLNETRGGTIGKPDFALVYDPAANGRTAGWGKADQGPSWWPWSLVLKFVASLHPWGDADPRVLGPNKVYAGIFPDTEPHVHLRFSARRTLPFPDRQVIKVPVGQAANVRSGPAKTFDILTTLRPGDPFIAYQYKPNGGLDNGTRGWYGDHDGEHWVHESGLTGIGGGN